MTIEELKKTARPRVVLSWAPHPRALPQAVPNSFVEWMKHADVDLVVTHPEGYELAPEFAAGVTTEYNQRRAFDGADFIYAKNWSSYQEYGRVLHQDPAWRITENLMARTNRAKFMHCLPVRRNVAVADEILDGPRSAVLLEAHNRLVVQMAVLHRLLVG
jgi:N-succinyl-L-ornithine transcarbamylase